MSDWVRGRFVPTAHGPVPSSLFPVDKIVSPPPLILPIPAPTLITGMVLPPAFSGGRLCRIASVIRFLPFSSRRCQIFGFPVKLLNVARSLWASNKHFFTKSVLSLIKVSKVFVSPSPSSTAKDLAGLGIRDNQPSLPPTSSKHTWRIFSWKFRSWKVCLQLENSSRNWK